MALRARQWRRVAGLLVLIPGLAGTPQGVEETCEIMRAADIKGLGRLHGSARQQRRLRRAEPACFAGEAECCLFVGEVLRGRVVPGGEASEALAFFERACAEGSAEGCWAVSEMYIAGEGGAVRRPEGTEFGRRALVQFADACTAGDPEACIRLGDGSVSLPGAAAESVQPAGTYGKALEILRSRCSSGDSHACARLGQFLEAVGDCQRPGMVEATAMCRLPDVKRVFGDVSSEMSAAYKRGCELGNGSACESLALTELVAPGGAAESAEPAVRLLQRACDLGWAQACHFLGAAYSKSGEKVLAELDRAVPKDSERATRLFEKGCLGGYTLSCPRAAEAYSEGRGVARDLAKASRYLERACEDGISELCR
jgi:TPR repeat protein